MNGTNYSIFEILQIKFEHPGIDPGTSRMLSEHSTTRMVNAGVQQLENFIFIVS